MDTLLRAVLLTACAVAPAAAQTLYQCKTPDGVMFSDQPCGEDAKALSLKGSSGTTSASARQRADLPAVPPEKFRFLPNAPDEVMAIVGPPAASFTHRGTEHWLYPHAVRVEDGGRACPELLVDAEDGMFQINWLPEDVMLKAVVAAAAIGDWERRGPVREKPFYAVDSGIRNGDRKAAIVARIGEPDAKKVFNGNEWWEYEQVRMSPADPQTLTLFLEFEGEVLVSSAGN